MSVSGFRHEPVMVDRIVELLAPCLADGGLVVDATVGLGGHAEALLTACPAARVLGVDRDPEALAAAGRRLAVFPGRFLAHRGVFDSVDEALSINGLAGPSAYLFDLGVSSLQLDSDARGFAYARDTRLDMRMDPADSLSAEDVVNDYDLEGLTRVFRDYGEERHARRIARRIVEQRKSRRITTTQQLTDTVRSAVPPGPGRSGHPAKRVFQAIRIEVNDELGSLERGLTAAVRSVAVDGRIAVLSYHSLEDRLVKRTFASGVRPPVPPRLPATPPDARPFLTALTRGAEKPGKAEIAANPRAGSARLRAVARLGPVPASWQGAA